FIQLFRRTFAVNEKHLPLFVFMAGSPFFFKNFLHTLRDFDIFWCAGALCLLLIPARSIVFVLLAALFSATLILIHHIHVLMYVPTIAAIVRLVHYLTARITHENVCRGFAAILALGALFPAAQFWGTVRVPEPEFLGYLRGKMADP